MPDPKNLLQDIVDLAASPGIATDIGGIPNDLTAANTPAKTPPTTNANQQKTGSNTPNRPGAAS